MKNLLFLSLLAIVLVGCAAPENKPEVTETSNQTTDGTEIAPVGGVGAAMGGAAPVQGGENLGSGSGGGVGQAATAKARSTAAAQTQRTNENEATTE